MSCALRAIPHSWSTPNTYTDIQSDEKKWKVEFIRILTELIPFLYGFVLNGNILIKYILSCVHQTNTKSNDKLIVVDAYKLSMLG